MSQELHAFLKSDRLPDRQQWQQAIDALGLPLELDANREPARDRGYWRCKLDGKDTGIEIYTDDAQDVLGAYSNITKTVGKRDRVISFRWRGDLSECGCACTAAAALASAFDAVVYDPQQDLIADAAGLIADARQCY